MVKPGFSRVSFGSMSNRLRQDMRWITREGRHLLRYVRGPPWRLHARLSCWPPAKSALASGQISTVPKVYWAHCCRIWPLRRIALGSIGPPLVDVVMVILPGTGACWPWPSVLTLQAHIPLWATVAPWSACTGPPPGRWARPGTPGWTVSCRSRVRASLLLATHRPVQLASSGLP
jgi:hypothetical protein